jgi:hypothetical protein
MRCDLARFFSRAARTSKMEIYTSTDPDFRSELVIWLESDTNGCVCSIMSKVAFENFGQSSGAIAPGERYMG